MGRSITRSRQKVSSLVILSLIVSLFWGNPQPAQARVIDLMRNLTIDVLSLPPALVMGTMGAVVGGIVGGPIGLVAGGIAGFVLGKTLIHKIFSGKGTVAKVLCGVTGAVIGAGLGLPGIIVGGVIGSMVGKILATGGLAGEATPAAAMEARSSAFLRHLEQHKTRMDSASQSSWAKLPEVIRTVTAQTASEKEKAFRKYQAAYEHYSQAIQKGRQELAERCGAELRRCKATYDAILTERKN